MSQHGRLGFIKPQKRAWIVAEICQSLTAQLFLMSEEISCEWNDPVSRTLALQMPGELRSCEPIDYTVEKMYNWRTFERNGSHFNRDNFPTIAATSIVIATRIITW